MEELIEELRKKYTGEWLAIHETEYENWNPQEGLLPVHNPDKEVFHREIRVSRFRSVCYTYGGAMIPSGYEVLLPSCRSLSPWSLRCECTEQRE